MPRRRAALQAKVLTVSDGVAAGTRTTTGGAGLVDPAASAEGYRRGRARGWSPTAARSVGEALVELAEGFAGLIVTTGGTGFGPRDLTPEGTLVVLDRQAPGLAEAMRLVSPLGRLSRAVAGTRGRALILNTPGSPKGAVECLEAVLDVVPHVLRLLADEPTEHHSRTGTRSRFWCVPARRTTGYAGRDRRRS